MRQAFNLTVLIASLGYFVDMFDLTIFGVVRIASLQALGISEPAALTRAGVLLLNMQAMGMLIGGILWGILGDKKGRLSVLFGSILLYSIANFCNAFTTDLTTYAVLRFIAGVGLAGELGAAVTLVSELLPKEIRGYGTAIIATLGLGGAVAASLLGQFVDWKTAYIVGGVMGLFLLLTRFKMADSKMFKHAGEASQRGNIRLLLNRERGLRYLFCVLAGVPIYFTTGVLLTFSPELSLAMGLKGVTAGQSLLFGTIGLTLGDLLSGLLSQWIGSRKKAVLVSFIAGGIIGFCYFNFGSMSPTVFYAICFGLGLAAGYWAVLITMAAEQFGTNIRATVATSVPNLVRSSVIILTSSFTALASIMGSLRAAEIVGAVVLALAIFSLSRMKETFGRDLDFNEEKKMRRPALRISISVDGYIAGPTGESD